MPSFTRDELQPIIDEVFGENFVATEDAIGLVDPGLSQREILRFSALTFLQNPDTIFYLAAIFRDALVDKVETLITDLTAASEAVDDTIKTVEVPSTTYLEKASAHLSRTAAAIEDESYSTQSVQKAITSIADYTDPI